MLLVFPAMISLDLRRRSAARADLLCCLMPESPLPKKKIPERTKSRNSKNDKVNLKKILLRGIFCISFINIMLSSFVVK